MSGLLSKMDLPAAFEAAVKNMAQDHRLCVSLALSFAGVMRVASKSASDHGHALKQVLAQHVSQSPSSKQKSPAVDATFLRRLRIILRIAIPGVRSYEAFLLLTQAVVLVARSLLSLRILRLSGDGLREVMNRSTKGFARCLIDFFLSGLAASVINSALKYLTNLITVRIRLNLSRHVHDKYMSQRNYYNAAILRQGNLDNADQRIVEDLHQFCITAADLFSRTFKPAIDVVLSTMRMAENMGYGGLAILYSYFLLNGFVVRAFSPPISKMIAQQQVLEGNFRRAHTRLIQNAEEIAFLQGSAREEALLNGRLQNVTDYSLGYFFVQFRQGMIDQFVLKYGASMVGWPVLAIPFLMRKGEIAETAARYRESDGLIQAASASIGELVLVYKKLQRLAGFTTRVSELLEAVDHPEARVTHVVKGVEDQIEFRDITINAPDNRLLVKSLNLVIPRGMSVFVSGANGAGKSSMFRVLAGLWRPVAGEVVMPPSHATITYVPQKPYLVSGSLRDQVTYPLEVQSGERDKEIAQCLANVGLERFVANGGLDVTHYDWADVLSGGEKQRVGLARLYFHKPDFAILDEATSAINANEEGPLYEHLARLNMTVFSISHREALKKYHKKNLHFIGDGSGAWTLTDL
eukprot:c53660_g1_i1.p1 GENE.c53660_g1_i1~~c53660_g1_i1.p1  ORF type:complete len:649 (-),score=151.27 c53660_g1_i1:210-2117(-)